MNLLDTLKGDVSSFWTKLVNLWNGVVMPALTEAEQTVLGVLAPLFGQFEADELQVAINFIQGVITAEATTKGVEEWETVILNLAEAAGGGTWTIIQKLAGVALQTLIGLVLTSLRAKAAA